MQLFRFLQIGNCVGDEGSCVEADLLVSVTTEDAQKAFIILSAGLSLAKSMTAIWVYSYVQVGLVLFCLICTVVAFYIFIIRDYNIDFVEQIDAGYGNNIKIYLIAFINAILMEWVSTVLSYTTIATYKKIKANQSTSVEKLKVYNKDARRMYLWVLAVVFLMEGAVPLIAFGKADWKTDTFAPSNFGGENSKLLMSALLLALIIHGLTAMTAMVTMFSLRTRSGAFFCLSILGIIPILTNWAMIYAVLAGVEGREAGGLCYLYMIGALQGIDFVAEYFRNMFWLQVDLSIHPSNQKQQRSVEENET